MTPAVSVYAAAVDEFKRALLVGALAEHGWNKTRAARALGLQRTYVLFLMRRHAIPLRAPTRRQVA